MPSRPCEKNVCNCKKSRCLKLYCECFAARQICQNCNCSNCENTMEHESARKDAIKSALERNPNAFKPKIEASKSGGRHSKGCHCKKSGCKKKYCECFQAGIACAQNCKCANCENTDEHRALRQYGNQGKSSVV